MRRNTGNNGQNRKAILTRKNIMNIPEIIIVTMINVYCSILFQLGLQQRKAVSEFRDEFLKLFFLVITRR